MTRFLAGLILALFALSAPAAAQPVDTGHLVAELVPASQGVFPGQTVYVALRQKIDKGWHTYWRNSGDSGEATRIAWTLPPGWTAGDIVWAPPERQPTGPLMNYGYKDEVLLPVAITAPADARPGQSVTLKAAATFLVCEEICVPEDAALQIDLPVTAAPPPKDPRWAGPIEAALAVSPKPAGLTASFQNVDGKLKLAVTGAAVKGLDAYDAYFFPFSGAAIDHAEPQSVERGPEGLTLAITPGYAFQQADAPSALGGVLEVGGKAFEIEASAGAPLPGAAGLGPPPAPAQGPAGAGLGLPLAALFAVLGGLILNLMPCVFPVLAMKAASLAGHGHEHAAARRQGLAFLAGVLATFLALAGGLIALKAAGAAVGWGFQLQSPPVVAALALLMLAVALNLSGVFEVGTSVQGVGAGLASRAGLLGAFFTGALAVVVAAPCTAPFMAPALGWALTQDPASALVVFLALGVGFAAPFTAIAFAPALLRRLPRPGPWMDGLRRLLAFPMYGAAAWLVWVLSVQVGPAGLARLLAAAVVAAFAAWLAGVAQRRGAAGQGRARATGLAAAAVAALALVAAVWPPYGQPAAAGESAPVSAAVPYEAYSAERLAALRAEGRPVFVNYTAAWCVTCQVNEQVALSTQGVADALSRTGAVYLKADWTRKDAAIAAELARHGRAGVPLYLVYAAGGGEPRVLPQLLTEGAVVQALEAAARGS
ncbi:MAG: protein-disulfide reductase DsbD family protein [Phenylobacterium sp.]|uniref:protein-disulfide reductase DsbD family protein n=1 Tax=Phenylobacterium sp. TaxID=1871053 RepID=UPI00391BC482